MHFLFFKETPKKGKKSASDQDAKETLLNDITKLRQEVQGDVVISNCIVTSYNIQRNVLQRINCIV